MSATRRFFLPPSSRRLGAAAVGLALLLLAGWQLLPPEVAITPGDGSRDVDPHRPLSVESLGLGSRLARVEVSGPQGRLVGRITDTRFVLDTPLAFGTRYAVAVSAERPWLQQSTVRNFSFETVAMPALQGSPARMLRPDGSLSLRFDRPVGDLEPQGDLSLAVEADQERRVFRLRASHYAQGRTYPLTLKWATTTGAALPPLTLKIATPPPLTVRVNARGLQNIGLALPLLLTFSEPPADSPQAVRKVSLQDQGGRPVRGRWTWLGSRQLQFTPQPGWPAGDTIRVGLAKREFTSVRGGWLEQNLDARFTTGSDRQINVYLDRQRVEAIENGEVVRSFVVSTGKTGTPTVSGTYYIYARYPIKTMRSQARPGQPGYYVVENVPYAQYFHGGYAFHGAWWHNNFGQPVSHGCVNMSTHNHNRRWPGAQEDAGWLYEWANLGVPVTVYRRSPAAEVAG